jgi:arginine repressor
VWAVLINILNRNEIKSVSQKQGLDMEQDSVSRLLTTIWRVKLAEGIKQQRESVRDK